MDTRQKELAKRAAQLQLDIQQYRYARTQEKAQGDELRLLTAAVLGVQSAEWILSGDICPTSRPRV